MIRKYSLEIINSGLIVSEICYFVFNGDKIAVTLLEVDLVCTLSVGSQNYYNLIICKFGQKSIAFIFADC